MSKDTYNVPGQVALAASTGRAEFIDGLISEVQRSGGLTTDAQVEVLRMCRDLIADRQVQQTQFNEMKKLVRFFIDFGEGIGKKADELRELVKQAENPSPTAKEEISWGNGP